MKLSNKPYGTSFPLSFGRKKHLFFQSNTIFWVMLLVFLEFFWACDQKSKGKEDQKQPTFHEQLLAMSKQLQPYFANQKYTPKKINNPKISTRAGLEIETSFPINDLSFSPDNQFLASCGIDAEDNVQVWGLEKGKLNNTAGKGYFYKPVFTPDNRFLIYTALQNIEIWDIQQNKLANKLPFSSKNIVFNFSGLMVCEDSALRIFQANVVKGTANPILPEGDPITGISFGSSSQTLELLNRRNAIVWENDQIYRITHDLVQPISSRFTWKNGKAVIISETGRSLTIKNAKDEVLWEVKGKEVVLKSQKKFSAEDQKMIDFLSAKGFYDAVLFSPDGKYLAAIYHSFLNRQSIYFLRIFEMQKGKMLYESEANQLDINVLSFSPDSQYLALGLGDNIKKSKGLIKVYDFATLLKK